MPDTMLTSRRLPSVPEVFQEKVFHKSNAAAFPAGRVCQGAAAKTHGPDRAVDHLWRHLKIVIKCDWVISFVDAFGQETGDELGFHAV